MIKRIKVKSLIKGMYVHKLECKWTHHPFLFNQFKLKSDKELAKIHQAGIQLVQIDTEKGLDLMPVKPAHHAPACEVPFEEEMKEAQKISSEAKEKINDLMEDVKLGKNITVDGINPIVHGLTESVFRNQNALNCLGQIRTKDGYLFEHSVNIGVLIAVFGRFKGFDKDILNNLVMGAFLHDIGKIKVPDEILNKPGKLTREEFEQMKMHVVYTEEVLEKTEGIPAEARQIAAEHHEKMNGLGYAKGLKGDEISLYGRMAGIVDVYDALTATRVYHDGKPPADVLKMMNDWAGSHFDRSLLTEFIACMGLFPVGSLVELTDGHLAIVLENGANPLRPHLRIVMHRDSHKALPPRDISLEDEEIRIIGPVDHRDYGIKVADYYQA